MSEALEVPEVSPAARWTMSKAIERAGGHMRLEACHALRADVRVVARAGRQLQAIPDPELGRGSHVRQAESDGPAFAHQDLVVPMLVGGVVVVRPVGPGTRLQTLAAKALAEIAVIGHPPTDTPMMLPTA